VITNIGNGTLNAAGVFNFGSIQAVAGTLTVSNLVAEGGTVFIGPGGTLTTTGIGALTNFGTISLAGAAGNNAILNLGTAAITNLASGTITGGGIVQNAAQVVNLGNIFATSAPWNCSSPTRTPSQRGHDRGRYRSDADVWQRGRG